MALGAIVTAYAWISYASCHPSCGGAGPVHCLAISYCSWSGVVVGIAVAIIGLLLCIVGAAVPSRDEATAQALDHLSP